jgi:hypothetical protein
MLEVNDSSPKGEKSLISNLTAEDEDDLNEEEEADILHEYEEHLISEEDLEVFRAANPNIKRVWAIPFL